jgi:hypothetical protein
MNITEHNYNANQIVVYHNNRLPPPPNPQQQQQPRRGRPPQYEIVRGIGQNVEGIRVDIAAIPAEVVRLLTGLLNERDAEENRVSMKTYLRT